MSWFDVEERKIEDKTGWFDIPSRSINRGKEGNMDAFLFIFQKIVEAIVSSILAVNDSLSRLIQKVQDKKRYQISLHFITHVAIVGIIYLILNHRLVLPIGLGSSAFFTLAGWWRVYRKEQGGTFGKASFSTPREIKQAELINRGIVFGRSGRHLVTKPSNKDGHVMVLGGSGSGKTKSMAIPSLINWTGSAICIDPKGELAQTTSHVRPGKSYIFDPTKEDCDQYNPVSACNTIEGAQELAQVLLPASGGDQFWNQAARGILAGALIEGYHRNQTLQEVCERVCKTDGEQLRNELVNSMHLKVSLAASVARDAEGKLLTGIMAEIRSRLAAIAADDNIKYAMSRNDWTPKNLEMGETIYLSIPEKLLNLAQYKAILNIIVNQTISHLCSRDEGKNPPIMILIDELPRLGYIPQLVESIATLRSRNVHMVLIFQGFSQLDEHYGVNGRKTIVQNCDYKLILRCTEPETQQYLSNLAGQKTVKSTSTNKNEDEDQTRLNETGVPLIRPEEWGEPDRQPVLFTPLTKPILISRKAWYNEDPDIKKKIKLREARENKREENNTKESAEVIPFKRSEGARESFPQKQAGTIEG